MAIERKFGNIIRMSDPDLFQWRADVRQALILYDDAELAVLYEGSMDELVHRARHAWGVVVAHNARKITGAA